MSNPVGAQIEIVEQGKEPLAEGTILVPNCVRINGQELYTSAEHPVRVESIDMENRGAVYVTLTLLARRVSITDEVVSA